MNDLEKPRLEIERWVAVAGVSLLAFSCLLILRPFISAVLWAVILCFTTWPLFSQFKRALGERRTLAALIATLLLSAIIVAPIAILVERLSSNLSEIIAASQKLIHEGPPPPPSWVANVPLIGPRLSSYWTLLNESSSARIAEVAKLLPVAEKVVLGGGRALGQGVFQILISLVMVFVFYRHGETAADLLTVTLNRIGGDEGRRLLDVAGTTVRAVVYGVLGTALVQGVLGAIGFVIAGVPGAAVFGFLTFIVAPIPGGPILVAAPAVFWLWRGGSTEWAVFMLVWALIVGNLDNFIRPFLISRGGGTTPIILVILGLLGGAMTFGLIGLFLGPTLLAIGYSMFQEWIAGT
jgi:predicted PurR-regulated permease PerM